MVAARPAASLREKPRSLPSSAAFSSAGRSGEVISYPFPLPLWARVDRRREATARRVRGCFREFHVRGNNPSSGASRHLLPQGEKGGTSRHVLIQNLHGVV